MNDTYTYFTDDFGHDWLLAGYMRECDWKAAQEDDVTMSVESNNIQLELKKTFQALSWTEEDAERIAKQIADDIDNGILTKLMKEAQEETYNEAMKVIK